MSIGKREQQRQSAFGAYYKNCDCSECTYVKMQLNANRSPDESKNDAREMTAEDLGLPLGQWDADWLTGMYGCCRPHLWMWLAAWPKSVPSYAFWLGAEAA